MQSRENEVHDIIDGDWRLTVREVAEKCFKVLKTSVHDILFPDLNTSQVCARWVPRLLTSKNLENRVELSRQFVKKFDRGSTSFFGQDCYN